ncbi:substrate-binding domain-containing protein [Paenibacillus sp. SN-8-1]|uniref:substrate-binding domain-containing protein n=1 Tax=Paenibacillus sp. SN-8-1 TaxID=3435409 RepID=UPI003D9A2393
MGYYKKKVLATSFFDSFGSIVQLFAPSSRMAELGCRIPDDLAVIGFNNIILRNLRLLLCVQSISAYNQMGCTASQSLIRLIKNEPFSQQHILIPHRLAARESMIAVPKCRWASR